MANIESTGNHFANARFVKTIVLHTRTIEAQGDSLTMGRLRGFAGRAAWGGWTYQPLLSFQIPTRRSLMNEGRALAIVKADKS